MPYISYIKYFLCRTKGTIDCRHRKQDLHCQTSAIAHSWSNIILYFTTQTTLVFSTNLAQRTFLLKFLFHLVCLFAFQLLLFIPLCSLLQWISKKHYTLLKEWQSFWSSVPSQCSSYTCTNDLLKPRGLQRIQTQYVLLNSFLFQPVDKFFKIVT